MRRWPDPRTLPFDPAYGYAVLGMFALLLLYVVVVVGVVWWRSLHRADVPLHTEWNLADDGRVSTFEECGCLIGADHWQDGEPHRG